MRRLGSIFSHVHVRTEDFDGKWFGHGVPKFKVVGKFQETTNQTIRAYGGWEVNTFPDLVTHIATLAYANPTLNLFFRGQTNDYLDQNRRTKIYPTIYRAPGTRLSKKVRLARFKELDRAARAIAEKYPLNRFGRVYERYPEYAMALLQHYEVIPTALLDVTQSIRVAATFALTDKSDQGYFYVLGLPYPHGTISHLIDDSLVIVKLQNFCPPEALRPHFQDGFLVGSLPMSRQKDYVDNFAYRLVAKYKLINTGGTFWSPEFPAIPMSALMPPKDFFGDDLMESIFEAVV